MNVLNKRFPHYSKLLALYPAAYRKKYGEQMLQTLADMLDDASSPASRAAIWTRTVLDLPISLIHQQLSYASHAFAQETPSYVKRNALIAALLLVPFFVIVVANDLTAHGLYRTWLWHDHVLFAWIVALPALALGISLVTFIGWLVQNRRKQSFWRNVLDVRHSWPLLVVGVIGLGIIGLVLFHDSVHCLTGNPIREVRNPRATWHCIEQR